MLRIAKVIPQTTAEGPFERCAIWVAGCDLACPGCCNPLLFDPNSVEPTAAADLLQLLDGAQAAGVEGITVLGGEPLQQPHGLAWFVRAAQARGLGVIAFTGYTLKQAQERPAFDEIWANLDTLIDGRFDRHQPELRRRFIGSSNQCLHHRTTRYAAPELWRGPQRIEVHVDSDGGIEVHGLPRSVSRLTRALSSG
ncbi:MAG: radical SAM protein [Nannocystaceae bacterium]|nr:radical SAM protein [Nannocystaceae bacterium]